MIIKASERGGAQGLARHLLNSLDNDHVEVHEVSGTVSKDVEGALTEMYAISRATRCKNFMFSVSLSPPPEEVVPVEDFEAAIQQIEESLGLENQPKVVLFHEKENRRHCHVVFSRIDGDALKAINLPFYKERLFEIAKEQFLVHGWAMPEGFRDRSLSDPRNYSLEEYQVARRAKRDPREIKSVLKACWAQSDDCRSFKAALKERGFWLCQGDRRGFVLMEWTGNIYSLSRWIGESSKALKAKLGSPDALLTTGQTKENLVILLYNKHQQFQHEFEEKFEQQLAPHERKRREIILRHRAERRALHVKQDARRHQEAIERSKRVRGGWRGLWDWITGSRARIRRENEMLLASANERDQRERMALVATSRRKLSFVQSRIKQIQDAQTQATFQLHVQLNKWLLSLSKPQWNSRQVELEHTLD